MFIAFLLLLVFAFIIVVIEPTALCRLLSSPLISSTAYAVLALASESAAVGAGPGGGV